MPASPALDARSPVSESVAVVIPTLNEAESIGAVIAALPRHLVDHIIVADGGSTDGTPQIARGAGAEVIAAGAGYGRACLAGAEAAGDADVLVFMDGDGADDPSAIEDMVAALRSGGYDFVIGSRTRGKREASSMAGHQILAGIVIGGLIRLLYGVHYTDMAAFRAIRRATLFQLGMREMTYGWNLEMQMRAARAGLRIVEIPVDYRRRSGGRSKVTGSLRGSIKAAARIIATFLRVAIERKRQIANDPRRAAARRNVHLGVLRTMPISEAKTPPILRHKNHEASSAFTPENLLRQASQAKTASEHRRPKSAFSIQMAISCATYVPPNAPASTRAGPATTPSVRLPQRRARLRHCGCAVGAAFAVLIAEELFASGCRLLISITSAGQIAPLQAPPYFVVIDRALRDEGTSYHYLPASEYSEANVRLTELARGALSAAGMSVRVGASWTTDAPFRETGEAIAAALHAGILAVEMEAAALYAFAKARGRAVVCFAHVTNQMGRIDEDFEKKGYRKAPSNRCESFR